MCVCVRSECETVFFVRKLNFILLIIKVILGTFLVDESII